MRKNAMTRLTNTVALSCAAVLGLVGTAMAEPHGTLRWGVGFEPQGWNPQTPPNTTFTQLVYDTLIRIDADGTTLTPGLAESWEITPESLTFTLREGAVFHDGSPVDADAVIANLENVQGAANRWREAVSGIESAVKVDDLTVRIDLRNPSPALPYVFSQRGLAMISPAALEAGTWERTPVGSGPYVYNADASVSGSRYVFDVFAEHWDYDNIGPARVEVVYLPDASSRFNALLAGQVDAADGDPSQMPSAEAAGLVSDTWRTLRYHLIMFDRDGALGDVRVRQAMCKAMPLEHINAARYDGLLNFPSQRFDEGDPSYNPDIQRYEYDIEAARALMAEAGVSQLNLQMPSPDFMRVISELTRESFGMIGIDLDVQMMPTPEYFQSFYSGRYPLIINTFNPEMGGMFNYYGFRFSEGGAANTFNVAPPPRLEELYQLALVAPEDEQPALLQEMAQIIHDEALDCAYFDAVGIVHYNPATIAEIATTTWEPSALRYRDVRMQE